MTIEQHISITERRYDGTRCKDTGAVLLVAEYVSIDRASCSIYGEMLADSLEAFIDLDVQ